jgi:hypothetical protein
MSSGAETINMPGRTPKGYVTLGSNRDQIKSDVKDEPKSPAFSALPDQKM